MATAFLVTFGIRGLSLKYGWSLPVFVRSAKQDNGDCDERDSTPSKGAQ
jgi:hypothetical protein